MGLFNLERSHCQDQAEYDTSDSGQHSLVLFFTLSPVAVTVLPSLFLSFTLSPLIFYCLSLFSSSLDLSLRKVFETHIVVVYVFLITSLFTYQLKPFWFYGLLYNISCY